ncbi:MAG: ferrochelatase [Bradymonadaceae bacterium]
MTTRKRGILLVNLGSPDSTKVEDVRRYLDEFLSDPRVLDIPKIKREAILRLFILPFRPKKSAHAYEQVWTEEGSPLIVTTFKCAELLSERIDAPIAVGMRYGNPSAASAVQELVDQGVDEIFLIPLYPHYAMSSYETAVAKVQEAVFVVPAEVKLRVQPPFYDDPDYIEALIAPAKEALEGDYDHLLFSYHGIPERHLRVADSSKCFCLKLDDCCQVPNPAHSMCYRAQCFATTRDFVEKAGIPEDKYSISFQSRLGREPWLEPFTDHQLEKFPARGIKKLLIISPAFVSDCLETIEELGMAGKESFLEAGGEEYTLIPCMNTGSRWIDVLEKFSRQFLDSDPIS